MLQATAPLRPNAPSSAQQNQGSCRALVSTHGDISRTGEFPAFQEPHRPSIIPTIPVGYKKKAAEAAFVNGLKSPLASRPDEAVVGLARADRVGVGTRRSRHIRVGARHRRRRLETKCRIIPLQHDSTTNRQDIQIDGHRGT